MRRIVQGIEKTPIDGVCDYGLYGIRVADVRSRRHYTSLPSLPHTYSRNYGQTQVETARVGERWWLQMSLSCIIFSADVQGLVYLGICIKHYIYAPV